MPQAFSSGLTSPLDWINGIAPVAPNLSVDWIKHEVLIKLRYFFQRSHAWRCWVGPVNLQPGISAYSIEPTDYKAQIVSVINAYRMSDTYPLSPVDSYDHNADAMTDIPGGPAYYYQTPERLVHIFPVLKDGDTESVRLFISMMPTDLCVPDWIKEQHYDAIREGVLSKVYLTPGINYKPDLGARLEKRFRSEISKAARDAVASYNDQVVSIATPAPFAMIGTNQQGRSAQRSVSGRRW